ncbi:MAG: hypothetical protein WBP45_11955, partial [Daejeonella sp.]
MESLKIQLSHPIKGKIKFIKLPDKKIYKMLEVDTKDNDLLEISLKDFDKGKMAIVLEWEY